MAPGPKVLEALQRAESVPGEKGPVYEALLANIKELMSPETAIDDLNAVADSFFGQSLGVVGTRAVLTAFVETLKQLKNEAMWIEVGNRTLGILASQPSSFLDAAATLCELVATAHENNEDFVEAAKMLAAIPLDSSQRRVTDVERSQIWIRIARNCLEVDDTTTAERYITRAKNLLYCFDKNHEDLKLHFQLCQARIQDANRDFLSASQGYHDVSFSPAVADEERLHTLAMAIKCAILAPAGPRRSRILSRLYKDERSAQLDEFGILEKIFLDRLLRPDEVAKFAEGLQPHQLATTSDGSTVLAKAVVEHNLLAASRVYNNISFEALGGLLGLDAGKAEETTARMIEQGRLVGQMDQVQEIVWFEGSGRTEKVVGTELRRWDANVRGLAEEVENVTSSLSEAFPDFVAANLVV
ncbi:PCI domain-containing protein [Stachybotrys elegans]|uniref:COP9 signalosome complex subunit 4 n=1 Tax=Stachybotrys elegans TaxID=80388 RepID=A0A8K0WY27_9HYPO|nr:PCI domain-containing protein [Stachybotrys elegans]